jgi:succinate-acetate transporter protein
MTRIEKMTGTAEGRSSEVAGFAGRYACERNPQRTFYNMISWLLYTFIMFAAAPVVLFTVLVTLVVALLALGNGSSESDALYGGERS